MTPHTPHSPLPTAPALPNETRPRSQAAPKPATIPLERQEVRLREAVLDYQALTASNLAAAPPSSNLHAFSRWINRWPERSLASLSREEVRDYIAELTHKGYPTKEVEDEQKLLRSFLQWARGRGWIEKDLCQGLASARPRPSAPVLAWTVAEQGRLLQACLVVATATARAQAQEEVDATESGEASPSPQPSPLYLYALTLLGLRTGLSLQSLLNLGWRHLDIAKRRIFIRALETGRGKDLNVPLDPDAYKLLCHIARKARTLPQLPPRILEAVGLPLAQNEPDERQVLRDFRRAQRLANVREADFNSLRHTFFENLNRGGAHRNQQQ